MNSTSVNQPSINTLSQNRVARNAFLLIAISMIPTVIGTWVGMAMGIPAMVASSPLMFTLAYLVISFGLLFSINGTARSAAAIPLTFLFTGFMGLALSSIVSVALSRTDGISLIVMAALGTAAITIGCASYAATTKRDFSGIGGFLVGSVIALIVAAVANIWLQLSVLSLIISAVAIVVFSAFLVFDVQRVIKGGETNYVLAAVSIYLNIYNIFSSILNLILMFTGSDE